MKKTVLTFGLISGAVSASMMLITIPFADAIGWEKGEILGYTGIVLSADGTPPRNFARDNRKIESFRKAIHQTHVGSTLHHEPQAAP